MRLIKMFGLGAVAAVAAMAFVGATSASALNTQLCTTHTSLTCGSAATSVHWVLAPGTIWKLLGAIDILCLGFLVEATALGLGNPQLVHSLSQSFTGCGTGSPHNNCTMSIPIGQQPLFNLAKTGLDAGVLTAASGQTRLVCSNIGLDCLYDAEGMEFEVGAGHLTANETGVTELGGKFFCPVENLLDALLETLTSTYVLG